MRLFSLAAAFCLAAPVIARAEVPRVVADTPVVHSLVAQVMGDLGEPTLLVPPGADLHHMQLKPSQARALQRADAIFWVGPELTPWLSAPLEKLAAKDTAYALLMTNQTHLQYWDADAHEAHDDDHSDDDHGDDHDGDHADHSDDHAASDETSTLAIDPHAWLAPRNAQAWVMDIAQVLAAQDPQNERAYLSNATAAAARIDDMATEVAVTLAPAATTRLFFSHDGFGYFTQNFGLINAGAIASGDAAAPGAAHLRALHDMVQPAAQSCVFTEPQHSDALANALLEAYPELGRGVLDASGSSLPAGPDLYDTLMRAIADTIAGCQDTP